MIPRSAAARGAWVAFAATLPVYAATMSRTVGLGDSGELAAAAVTFGVPHPTGYPTLMLLSGALTHLLPLRPVLVLNALSACLTAAGAAVLTLLFDRILAAAGGASLAAAVRARHAVLAALFVAFTMTWWQQANGFEVYSLHALLMPLVVLQFLRWMEALAVERSGAPARATRRTGWAFAGLLGICFTNHLTTVLLAPGFLAALLLRFGPKRSLVRPVLALVPAFLVGLLPYAWLPIASSLEPRFDWGDPDTLRGFVRHVTGAQYRLAMFAGLENLALQGRYLMWRVPLDFAAIGIVVAGIGALDLGRRAPGLAALALGMVVAGAGFAAAYAIPDVDAYLLTVVLGLGILFAAGLLRLHERFGPRAALALAGGLVLVNGFAHWGECDQRRDRLAEGFVRDLVGPLPRDAVLFSGMWMNFVSTAGYLQEIEGFRRDVVIIDPGLTTWIWYLDELERRAPELVGRARGPLEAYRAALRLHERDRSADRVQEAEARRRIFIDALAAACMAERPVFTTGALPEARASWRRVPWQLALWLRPDSAYVPEPRWSPEFRPGRGRLDLYRAQLHQAYAEARLERARYEIAHGRAGRAERLVREALAFDPGIRRERVGPQPLGSDRLILRTADFFRGLRALDPVVAAR